MHNDRNDYTSNELNELYTALAKAQQELTTADLNASNPHYRSRYADLMAIIQVSRQPLANHGLSVSQLVRKIDGVQTMVTRLQHCSGQWQESYLDLLPEKPGMQGWGSAITYARRYGLAAICGIAAGDEDDDGEASENRSSKPNVVAPKSAPVKTPAKPTATPVVAKPVEFITSEQLELLEEELRENTEMVLQIYAKHQINNLKYLPKTAFMPIIGRIKELKTALANKK